ncbi:MAG: cytosine permease [Candidatus Nezhaarchaeales archaeon]
MASEKEVKDVYGDYSTLTVPPAELKSTLNLFMVYMGVLAVIAAIFAGSGLATMYDVGTMLTVAFVGNVVLGVFGALTAYPGGVTRANTYMLLRYPLGRVGAMIGGLIIAGISCGLLWFAVETWLFGLTTSLIFPDYWIMSIAAASIWGGLLMMTTAYIGYKGIGVLSYVTVPFWYVLCVIGLFSALDHTGISFTAMWALGPEKKAPFGVGITYVVGLYAAGCVITSDVSRYGVKRWSGSLAWAIHVILFMTILLFIGGVMTLATGSPNVIVAMASIGLGAGALLLAILGQWTTNDNNLWSGSLSFVNVFPVFKRRTWVLILGVIGTIIAGVWAGLYGMSLDPFITFGVLLGCFVPPVGGVLVADFYIFRRYVLGIRDPAQRYKFGPGTKYGVINVPGLIGLIVGGIVGWLTTLPQYSYGIPALNAIFVSAILYLLLIVPMHKAGVKYEVGTWMERETGF